MLTPVLSGLRVMLLLLVALGSGLAALGADVSYFGVIKSHQFEQPPGQAPRLIATNAFAFHAFVVAATNDAVATATVKVPNAAGTVLNLERTSNGMAFWYEATFPTQAALDAAFPSQTGFLNASRYQFTLHTAHDGVKTPDVTYFLSSLPRTPTITSTNLDAAQALDATRDFTLRWDSLNGGAADIVQLLVVDGASNVWYTSPAPFTAGALNGASVSAVVPAGQLPPGRDLTGHLAIATPGLPLTTSYSGAIGVAAHLKETAFPLVTLPAQPPWLGLPMLTSHGVELAFTGESNRVYHLLATPTLSAPPGQPVPWLQVLTTNTPTGHGTLIDPDATLAPARAYRLEVGP